MSKSSERKDQRYEPDREQIPTESRKPLQSPEAESMSKKMVGEQAMQNTPSIVVEQSTSPPQATASNPSEDWAPDQSTLVQDDTLNNLQHSGIGMSNVQPSFTIVDDLDDDTEIPTTIAYFTGVIFDGSLKRKLPESKPINIYKQDNFRMIRQEAQNFITARLAQDLGPRIPSFRYAYCTIIGDRGYRKRLPLRNKQEWRRIHNTFTQRMSQEKLHLNILQEYSARTPEHLTGSAKIESYKNELYDLTKRSWDGRSYIPNIDLKRFISEQVIRDIIHEDQTLKIEGPEMTRFIQLIRNEAQVIFAMWFYDGPRMKCLKPLLIDKKFTDQDLPININYLCDPECRHMFGKMLKSQEMFMAAQFDEEGGHQAFNRHVVIPIHSCPRPSNLSDASIGLNEHEPGKSNPIGDDDGSREKLNAKCGFGGYSDVYCVKIDPFHHSLREDRDAYFALKVFKHPPQKSAADFEQELRILDVLRRYANDNIVTHLATWIQDDQYCMLFPYAESNLCEYMRNEAYNYSPDQELWLLNQFRGLASALKQIHNLYDHPLIEVAQSKQQHLRPPSPVSPGMQKSGWHHDIKLLNILYFVDTDPNQGPPRRSFQLADWGAGKVHTYRSGSINTKSPNGTRTYEPPEVEETGATSRPYDVWSMGCVFLELLTWAAWTGDGVSAFNKQRDGKRDPRDLAPDDAFFQKSDGDNTYVLRPSVIHHIQELDAHFKLGQVAFEQILELVIQPMLTIRSDKRIEASVVWDRLNNIYLQAKFMTDLTQTDLLPITTDQGSSTPFLPTLSIAGEGHPESFPLSQMAGNMGGPNSPLETTSPRSYRGQLSPPSSISSSLLHSIAPRPRNTSNASSSISSQPRSGKKDPSKPEALASKDAKK